MTSKTLLLILSVALVSIGLTYMLMKGPADTAAHKEDKTSPPSEPAKIAGLKIAPAVAGQGWNVVVVTGKVTVPTDRLVKISPPIDGKIVAAYGTMGDRVRPGQVLAVISSVELAEARAQLRQAAARLIAAQKNHQRELQIAGLGAASVRPVEEARSEALSAQGELADAKSELAQSKSELIREESELAQCKARLERARELYADKIVSKQDLETAEAEFKRDSAAVETARLRITQAESRIAKEKSKSEIATQYLTREERIYKGRVIDMRSLQSARSEIAAAKIDVQSATDKIRVLGANPTGIGDTISVICPIGGRIISRNTNVGQMASSSDTLFTIADLSEVWIEADVYEKDLAKVRLGQMAEVKVDAYPDKMFIGKVDSIGDMLSPESRTVKVRCAVPNSGGLLRGEMFARVSLLTHKRGGTVLVAKDAVLDDAGKKIVFTTCTECPEDKKLGPSACGAYDRVEIATGAVHGDQIEVLKGLAPGTQVVTVGAYQLKTAIGSGKLEAGCSGH